MAEQFPGVCLVHGEGLLAEQALERLLTHLLQGNSRELNCEVLDGLAENVPEALEKLNTYGLLAGPKVVVFKDAKVFENRSDEPKLIGQIRESYENDNLPKAARSFLSLCSRLGLEMDSIQNTDKVHSALEGLAAEIGHQAIVQLARYCSDTAWSAGGTPYDPAGLLRQAIERGFPQGHHLILTVFAKVPKNLKLFKTIQSCGLIVDCSVPQGQRRADKMAQEAVLQQTLDKVLQKAGKQLAAGQFGYLCEMTGFDLHTFMQNLEKLVDYVGPRTLITSQDVQVVVRRSKRDPIYELTNAVADRNLVRALFYLEALLNAQSHPLQVLTALANQIRRLLVAKDFCASPYGRNWTGSMSFGQFQHQVLPHIQGYDRHIGHQVDSWQSTGQEDGSIVGNDRQPKADLDLYLAPGAKNPYAVFQILLKSEKFELDELLQAMQILQKTDLRLKSGGQDAVLILKAAVAAICRPGA